MSTDADQRWGVIDEQSIAEARELLDVPLRRDRMQWNNVATRDAISQFADGAGVSHLCAKLLVGQEPIVLLGSDRRPQRLRIDRNDTAAGAGDVDSHARVEERVVRHRHLAGEDPGGLTDVELASVRGDDQCTSTRQVELGRIGIVGVHPDLLQDLAEHASGRWHGLGHRTS